MTTPRLDASRGVLRDAVALLLLLAAVVTFIVLAFIANPLIAGIALAVGACGSALGYRPDRTDR